MSRRRNQRKRNNKRKLNSESSVEITESFDKLISDRKKETNRITPSKSTSFNRRVPIFLIIGVVLVSSVVFIASIPQINPDQEEIKQDRITTMYKFAFEQPTVLEAVFCYCYCNMGSLRGCFYTDTGDRDNHAENCEICLDEAEDSKRLFELGWTLPDISAYIDNKYG